MSVRVAFARTSQRGRMLVENEVGVDDQMRARSRRRHLVWIWLTVAVVAMVLTLLGRSVAAQTERGTDIIERALAATPNLRNGKALYRKFCVSCHGGSALQRQHYSYLLMQMRQLAVGHRYTVDIEIIQTLEALPFDYLTAIADYASRLPADSAAAQPAGSLPSQLPEEPPEK